LTLVRELGQSAVSYFFFAIFGSLSFSESGVVTAFVPAAVAVTLPERVNLLAIGLYPFAEAPR